MFCNKTIVLYFVTAIAVIFLILYAWRRIYTLQAYAQILEKKMSNLTKENKELKGLGQCKESCSFKDSDMLMNKIFMDCLSDNECKMEKKPVKVQDSTKIVKISNIEPAAAPKDASNDIMSEIEGIVVMPSVTEAKSSREPEQIVRDQADDKQDSESVISDAHTTTYNRRKLSKMSIDKLKEICSIMNISGEGVKSVLIDRIMSQ